MVSAIIPRFGGTPEPTHQHSTPVLTRLPEFEPVDVFAQRVHAHPKQHAVVGPNHPMLKEFGLSHKALGQALSGIATVLRPVQKGCLDPFALQLGQKRVEVRTISSGSFGQVYQLNFTQDDGTPAKAAFKVFHVGGTGGFEGQRETTGTLAEIRNELFLTAHPAKDKSRFYLGSPTQGWLMTEWIDDQAAQIPRTGKPLSDVLADHQLGVFDDKPANRLHGIIVDSGCIRPFAFDSSHRTRMTSPFPTQMARWPLAKQKATIDRLMRHPRHMSHVLSELGFQRDVSVPAWKGQQRFWSPELIRHTTHKVMGMATELILKPQWEDGELFQFTRILSVLPLSDRVPLIINVMRAPGFQRDVARLSETNLSPMLPLLQHGRLATVSEHPLTSWILDTMLANPTLRRAAIKCLPLLCSEWDDAQLEQAFDKARMDASHQPLYERASAAYSKIKAIQLQFYKTAKPFVHQLPIADQIDFYAHYMALFNLPDIMQAQARVKALVAKQFRQTRIPHVTWKGYVPFPPLPPLPPPCEPFPPLPPFPPLNAV